MSVAAIFCSLVITIVVGSVLLVVVAAFAGFARSCSKQPSTAAATTTIKAPSLTTYAHNNSSSNNGRHIATPKVEQGHGHSRVVHSTIQGSERLHSPPVLVVTMSPKELRRRKSPEPQSPLLVRDPPPLLATSSSMQHQPQQQQQATARELKRATMAEPAQPSLLSMPACKSATVDATSQLLAGAVVATPKAAVAAADGCCAIPAKPSPRSFLTTLLAPATTVVPVLNSIVATDEDEVTSLRSSTSSCGSSEVHPKHGGAEQRGTQSKQARLSQITANKAAKTSRQRRQQPPPNHPQAPLQAKQRSIIAQFSQSQPPKPKPRWK